MILVVLPSVVSVVLMHLFLARRARHDALGGVELLELGRPHLLVLGVLVGMPAGRCGAAGREGRKSGQTMGGEQVESKTRGRKAVPRHTYSCSARRTGWGRMVPERGGTDGRRGRGSLLLSSSDGEVGDGEVGKATHHCIERFL